MGNKKKDLYLKLGLLNIRSLNTGRDELIATVIKLKPDILALNETWTKQGQERYAPKVPGYSLKNTPRPHDRTGGGVGFLIRRGLRVRIKPHPPSELEQMWLELTVPGVGKVVVGTAYRPDSGLSPGYAIDALSESISIFAYSSVIFVLTDFNVDLLKTNVGSAPELLSFLSQQGLHQLVREPTRIKNGTATLLDLLITDTPDVCKSINVFHNPILSDHGLVLGDFFIKKPPVLPRFTWTRSLHNIDEDSFKHDLKVLPWADVYSISDVNQMVVRFNDLLISLFDVHAPLCKIKLRENPSPWLTDTVRTMMSLRDKALHRAHTTKLDVHYRYYKDLKNFATNAIKREKEAFFTHYVNNNKNKPTEMWKYLKKTSVLGNKNTDSLPQHLNDPDKINNFFLDVPGDDNINPELINFYKKNKHSSGVFCMETLSQAQIQKILNSIGTNAAGYDTITVKMIRMTLDVTLPIITFIINSSLTQSIFPSPWKQAKVKPLPKCTTVEEYKDLRAISILPVLSKVIERVVCSQLTKYVERESILPDIQSGFRSQHGTATSLAHVTDDILAASDAGEGSVLVLLDFSRAFDCISTRLLLAKMSYYGISESACEWFHSFLTERCQYVDIEDDQGNHKESQLKSITRGCPQGSILSPLMFILYTADLPTNLSNCKIHLYADDTQLYHSFKHNLTDTAVQHINEDLDKIYAWAKRNALVLNPTKSKYMILGTKRQCEQISEHSPCIKINKEMVERVKTARNLGLLIDEEMRFEEHINSKIRTAFFRLKILYGIRKFLKEDIRVILTESLVLSIFNYCDTVYGPRLFDKTSRAIQRVQNACTRFCFGIPKRSHITPYLNENQILKMEGRRLLHLAGLIYKVVHTGRPRYLHDKIKWLGNAHNIFTRSKLSRRMEIPKHKTANFKGSFKYAASKIWNDLPPPLHEFMSYLSFKIKLKKILLEKQLSASKEIYKHKHKNKSA